MWGIPFPEAISGMNTHDFEREVIHDFAGFTGIDVDDCWGYVTNGGTEGNMYGLYLARELFPDGNRLFFRGNSLQCHQDPAPATHA